MKKVLTIAGSDSGGGAGIQADLKTFAAYGVYGASAITAVTAQNTLEVKSIHPIPPDVVKDQLEAVLLDIGADAVKTGMLYSREIVTAVSRILKEHPPPHLVVDPVMISKTHAELLDAEGRKALIKEIFPLCRVVTPNIPEAASLLGRPLTRLNELQEAAKAIHDLGPEYVVIKGGHSEGETVVDLLYDGSSFSKFSGPRLETSHTHGTGCTLSAAIAACLALGNTVYDALASAREYLVQAMKRAPAIGHGSGPLNHGVPPSLHGKDEKGQG